MDWRERSHAWKRTLWQVLRDGLFPQNCIYCGGDRRGDGEFLCRLCRQDIEWIRRPYCSTCGAPAELPYDFPSETFSCGLCRKHPYAFDRARSLGRYDSILRELIHHFKYRKQPGVMADLNPLLSTYLASWDLDCEGVSVTPVPLHFQKMKERTFDQSFLIARSTAALLGRPLVNGLLRRVRPTETQASKTRQERRQNIRGAFEILRPDQVEGRFFLLVDDVFTTGSTVNEAARVLKREGAERVDVFTLARA